jgi:hypothetical protein
MRRQLIVTCTNSTATNLRRFNIVMSHGKKVISGQLPRKRMSSAVVDHLKNVHAETARWMTKTWVSPLEQCSLKSNETTAKPLV